jgi:uncharacterized membrane protein YccC
MTPWLLHGLRASGLQVECLDARRVKSALQMRLNKTDHNDVEGVAQVVRTGWYRAVHVKSLEAHQARSLLGARAQLVGMRTRLANMIRGVLKTFGILPGSERGMGIGFMWYWPVMLALVSRVAPVQVKSTLMGGTFLALFAGSLLMGWVGGNYDQLSGAQFWMLVASIGFGAALAISLARRPLEALLDPNPPAVLPLAT